MTQPEFLDSLTWYESLPGVVIAAGALITNEAGRVLLVKPNYRPFWTIPGGICEFGEPPQDGCAREVSEEIGLEIPVGRLLITDWSRIYGEQTRPIMHFIFDGGQIPAGTAITVQESELDGYRFTRPGELGDYLPPFALTRIEGALTARRSGAAVYLPHQAG